jgi:hypothetical protein
MTGYTYNIDIHLGKDRYCATQITAINIPVKSDSHEE